MFSKDVLPRLFYAVHLFEFQHYSHLFLITVFFVHLHAKRTDSFCA